MTQMRFQRFIAVALAVLLVVWLRWAVGRLLEMQRAESRAAEAALARDSVQAVRDTTRAIHMDVAALAESLRVVQRRAVQTAQRADRLDRALGLERAARVELRARIPALSTAARAETVLVATPDDERRAAFDVREAPYTVHAEVALPRDPGRARMELRVDLDTLALELRVGCGTSAEAGVRSATASVVAPRWAAVRMERVEQAPGVCSGGAVKTERGRWAALRRFVERFGVSVGYAAARGSDGTVVAGPGVVAGFRVWP